MAECQYCEYWQLDRKHPGFGMCVRQGAYLYGVWWNPGPGYQVNCVQYERRQGKRKKRETPQPPLSQKEETFHIEEEPADVSHPDLWL